MRGVEREARPESMDALLSRADAAPLLDRYGRDAVKRELRAAIAAGEVLSERLVAAAAEALARRFAPTLSPVINATGVLLHTNLGRAPLSLAAKKAMDGIASGYSTLEYDLATGERGRRQEHVRAAAVHLFGCEDAIAVNNNASAVFLALAALAAGRRVLVSRGELVAIGGSFRIPDILAASGATLAEVGTTNRTTIEDYRRGLTADAALLLTVHPSNYEIRGYTRRAEPRELAELSRSAEIAWVHDQGTGCVEPLDEFGVPDEPTVRRCLEDGASLVTFSGDKLLGGPQAGFAVGRKDLVSRLAAHPVARVVRPDKLTLAALSATLAAWNTGHWRELPIYQAASATTAMLEDRGHQLAAGLQRAGAGVQGKVVESHALFGGGTSPEKRFASRALELAHPTLSADALCVRLRTGKPAVIGRVEEDRALLDLRTILPEQDEIVQRRLLEI